MTVPTAHLPKQSDSLFLPCWKIAQQHLCSSRNTAFCICSVHNYAQEISLHNSNTYEVRVYQNIIPLGLPIMGVDYPEIAVSVPVLPREAFIPPAISFE